jgi:hypothetical protein
MLKEEFEDTKMVIRICKSKEKEEFEDTKMIIRICKSKEKEKFEDAKMVIRICKSKGLSFWYLQTLLSPLIYTF